MKTIKIGNWIVKYPKEYFADRYFSDGSTILTILDKLGYEKARIILGKSIKIENYKNIKLKISKNGRTIYEN